MRVERELTNVRFIARVKEFALTIRRNGEDLPFIPGCDVKSSVRSESEIPDVFRFRIEEDRSFTRRGNAIDLAVGRGSDIERAPGVKGDCLRH